MAKSNIYALRSLTASSKKLKGKLGITKHNNVLKSGDKVVVMRNPLSSPEQIVELEVVTIKRKDFPEFKLEGFPNIVIVGIDTSQQLALDCDSWGDSVLVMKRKDFNKEFNKEIQKDYVYPIHIILDRYMGVYSHGKWIAWAGEYKDIPAEIFDDDIACSKAWTKLHQKRDKGEVSFGIGDSPNKALDDLRVTIQAQKKE